MSRSSRWRSIRALVSICAVIWAVAFLSSCSVEIGGDGGTKVNGSGDVKTETRPVDGVSAVELATMGDLTITVGGQESLRIEAEDNLLQYLQSTVNGGRLTLGIEEGVELRPKEPIRYFLTIESLEAIEISSSGNVKSAVLNVPRLSLTISSSGNLDLDGVQADSLDVAVTSSGELTVGGGQVGAQTVRLTSSGDYDAGDLAASSANVDLTSSGNATVWVKERLEGRLTSSGDLSYYGSPQVSVDETSSGDLKSLGDK